MRRSIIASLVIQLSMAPALAQQPPLQGRVNTDSTTRTVPKPPLQLDPVVQPRFPSEADLREVKGALPSLDPTLVWSMTILPSSGMTVNSSEISWTVEYANPKLRHDWDVWLSRVMHIVYQDCSRFKCPNISDHTCTVHIRRDGVVVADIVPGGDVASALFKNAVTRLQGQEVLDFPPESHTDKVEFNLNLHYGKPVPYSSIFKDAFGQPDARYPIEKTNW